MRVPLVGAEVKAAAGRLRKVFSSLGVTQETYVVEANIGLQVGELLPALEADLRLFPVVGGTLFDWVSHLVATAGAPRAKPRARWIAQRSTACAPA